MAKDRQRLIVAALIIAAFAILFFGRGVLFAIVSGTYTFTLESAAIEQTGANVYAASYGFSIIREDLSRVCSGSVNNVGINLKDENGMTFKTITLPVDYSEMTTSSIAGATSFSCNAFGQSFTCTISKTARLWAFRQPEGATTPPVVGGPIIAVEPTSFLTNAGNPVYFITREPTGQINDVICGSHIIRKTFEDSDLNRAKTLEFTLNTPLGQDKKQVDNPFFEAPVPTTTTTQPAPTTTQPAPPTGQVIAPPTTTTTLEVITEGAPPLPDFTLIMAGIIIFLVIIIAYMVLTGRLRR